jgi:hypothetical protein
VPGPQNNSGGKAPGTDLFEFSERKQSLYRKLTNAGVWPDRAEECLRHYSPARIEANFELFRERAPEIDDHGAWLCAAITDGYADCSPQAESVQAEDGRLDRHSGADSSETIPPGTDSRPDHKKPDHKQKVTAQQKRTLIRTCAKVKPEHFHRYRHAESPTEKQFLYFDPEIGGPTGRGNPTGQASTSGSTENTVPRNYLRTSSP